MNLYKLTTHGLGDYYVMAHDPTAAETRLERLLNQANYGYKDARAVINIQLVSNELVDSWMDDKKANFNNKDRFVGVPLLCEVDFEPKFKVGQVVEGTGSMQELMQKADAKILDKENCEIPVLSCFNDVQEERIKEMIYELTVQIPMSIEDSYRYHTFCARATLYPNKTIDEVSEIIEETIRGWNKN